MNSEAAKIQYSEGATGAIQQHFNIETASNLLVLVPPLEEQYRLVEGLDRQLTHLSRFETLTAAQITKLREYRQTLISAAVTGKIDVTRQESRS